MSASRNNPQRLGVKKRLATHRKSKSDLPVDYWARLTAYHPTPLTQREAQELRKETRNSR